MSKLLLLWTVWLSCTGTLPSTMTGVASLPIGGMMDSSGFDQFGIMMRDYFRMLEKARAQPKVIRGQVNLRAPRSELMGDMAHALKLHQLQELDRTFGSKSRPRFGKRNEMLGQNEIPSYGYGYETYEDENPREKPLHILVGGPDDHESQQQQRRRR